MPAPLLRVIMKKLGSQASKALLEMYRQEQEEARRELLHIEEELEYLEEAYL